MNEKKPTERDLKKLFSITGILTKVINFAAYLILIASVGILFYISFVVRFNIKIEWTTLGIFTAAVVILVWLNWNNFYKHRYEKVMQEDIEQAGLNKYSVHSRYYLAIKDYTDAELQLKIDEFNKEYLDKWLHWVEKTTGLPIESQDQIQKDEFGNPVINPETNKPNIIHVVGLKDIKYRKLKNSYHRYLAWRIKHRHYPQSGYKTSMELMSLMSFQDANLNKRDLKASKKFYVTKSSSKFISTLLFVSITGSLVPEMIQGNIWWAIFKLIVALGSLGAAVLMGTVNGVRGARLKLSVVEEVCMDLEKWSNKKPILAPYKEPTAIVNTTEVTKEKSADEVLNSIFSDQN